jgi:hypothetical protein
MNHCAIYEFNEERSGWSKMNIEGPAFVVKRTDGSTPTYRMWVLNRVGRHNLKQDITATLETALNQGFHMFREASHSEQGLHSMWFPDSEKEKGVAFFSTLSQLSEAERRKGRAPAAQLPDQRGAQTRANNAPVISADKMMTASSSSSSKDKDWTGGESAGRALLAMLKGTPIASNGNGSVAGGSGGGGPASISSSSGSQSARSLHTGQSSSSTSNVDPSVAALFSAAAAAASSSSSTMAQQTPGQYGQSQSSSSSPPTLPPLLQQIMSSASSAIAAPTAVLTPTKISSSLSSEASPPPVPPTSAFRRGGGGGGGDDFLHAPLTLNKDQLKSLLLELVNEDAFVDLLHASYLKNEAKKRAQRIL